VNKVQPTATIGYDWAGDVVKVMGSKDGGVVRCNPTHPHQHPLPLQFILYFIINVIVRLFI
jgi:hypothetical protein